MLMSVFIFYFSDEHSQLTNLAGENTKVRKHCFLITKVNRQGLYLVKNHSIRKSWKAENKKVNGLVTKELKNDRYHSTDGGSHVGVLNVNIFIHYIEIYIISITCTTQKKLKFIKIVINTYRKTIFTSR